MLRLAQNGSPAAQASSSGHFQSWMGLHFCGHCLQPRTDAETAGFASSIRVIKGSSVSGGQDETLRTTKQRSKTAEEHSRSPKNHQTSGTRSNTSLRTPLLFRTLLEIARHRFFRCVLGYRNGRPTITSVTVRRRCLPLSIFSTARSSAPARSVTGAESSFAS